MFPPILSRRLLAEIFDLNLAFVRLLQQAPGAAPSLPVAGLTGPLPARLRALSSDRLDDLCACPFALFGLRFDDLDFWNGVREAQPSYKYAAPDAGHSGRQAFTLLALFYAWHLTAAHPLAARLCLGLPPAAARVFRSLPVSDLLQVAVFSPGLLHAQFDDNPGYWADLLETVEIGNRSRLVAMRVLGAQLLGARCAERAGRIRRLAVSRRSAGAPRDTVP
jgi:hypothetical protein